ncbi:Eukaryotic translation initiation factor 4B [Conoideocrella luteorostrata]|uniref:Eukaryotic translation initiation factor 4B n=1 Tax=Conoideocrella luteorostrata TaxID=1105319 RepID=A0AAJ0CCD8_9HYPO|nr:Eukaryotic translation initiation factor 4B [Conoideocrella luteorostrata]
MAPKKKEQQKMSLGDFMNDNGFGGGSWADEVEETYVTGTQPLPASDRPRYGGSSSGTGMSSWQDRGYSIREAVPTKFPEKPPFTAHLGNLSYDATTETVTEFFEGCDIVSVRIIEDRELMRPKGFGYVEFTDAEGLRKALSLDGESFQGRMIKIKVADPPRGGDSRGDSNRDLSDWSRKGPLPDLPGRSGGGRAGSDYGGDRERRAPRDPAAESRAPREMTWERRGPLAPLPPQEGGPGPRDGSRPRPGPDSLGERGESHRGSRQGSASWGEGRQEGARPPRREQPERERVVTAAEKDFQWRSNMRPDAAKEDAAAETPASPSTAVAVPAAAPASRPRLNLQKRTVSEATDAVATPGTDAKASPFGAARPINTAAREQEIEDKRKQAIREKKEADEKAKEERRIAKQAAAEKEEADAREEAAKQEAAAQEEETKAADTTQAEGSEKQEAAATEQKDAPRSREPREPKESKEGFKSKATESSNWRSASGEQRGSRGPRGGRGGTSRGGPRNDGRGPRANGASSQRSPAQEADDGEGISVDEDGWTTVPNKKGRQGRP